MLGKLPRTLEVSGRRYEIRTDYRDVLKIISAFNDKDLSDSEKVYVCMAVMFKALDSMPREDYAEAYRAATQFIECRLSSDKPSPRIINWEKDEQIMFPAINKVAGAEIRALPYLHWWTFLGYFQAIDRDDLWGMVLTIRQKRARGKKLEKYEKEFLNANRELCALENRQEQESPEDQLLAIYEQLIKEGGTENG